MTDHSNHKVLDLFAGSGVGVAIQNLGAEEFGVENMKEAIATRTANGMKTVYENVWDAHKAEMMVRAWRAAGIKWTLWASPPCQTFSLAGNGVGRKALDDVLGIIARKQYIDMAELREQAALLGDERIGLVLSPFHYAVRFRPTYIAFEQVPPVLPVWEAMAVELRELGYSVWVGILHSEQYGVPQTRKRAILMARNDGGVAKPPTPTHSKYYNRTPEKLDVGVEKWVSMERGVGWGWQNRPAPTVLGAGVHGASGVELFDRGSRAKMLDGIVTGAFIRNGRVVNPKTALDPLRLAPEESAMLQSYPEGFAFSGNKSRRFLQSGNAVPVLLAQHILEALWADDEVETEQAA